MAATAAPKRRGRANHRGPAELLRNTTPTSGYLSTVIRRSVFRLGLAVPALVVVTSALAAHRAQAQAAPPATAPVAAAPRAPRAPAPAGVVKPPLTPRRAFLYSVLVPGAGQAALGRHTAGGVFFLTEALALALVHRSAEDLRVARQFRADSTPASYQLDATGQPLIGGDGRPVVATWNVGRIGAARVRARRTHYEDWLAVVIFNHLFAGADAFVAAQLWDLPARVGVGAAPDGSSAVVASLRFR